MHLPIGVAGWTIFATGLLLVAYRIHGIDGPRAWIEWTERTFTYAMNLRLIGVGILIIAGVCAYLGKPTGLLVGLFAGCIATIGIAALFLLVYQNHARHFVIATAESSDARIRINAGIYTLIGLLVALAPFFL